MAAFTAPVAFMNADKRRWIILTVAGIVVSSIVASKLEGKRPRREGGKTKAKVDAHFFNQLSRMLRIAVPGPTSTEALIGYFLTAMLFARTALSIVIANIAGVNAQHLVTTQWGDLMRGVRAFAIATIPAAVVNSSLKWSTTMLALRIRYRLSKEVNARYLCGTNFYKATQYPSVKIDNADQRLTSDIAMFSDAIADLYANIAKPLLDVVIYTYSLADRLGWQAPVVMYIYFALSSAVKKRLMPSFGRMVAKQSDLEGLYRTAHQRVITNAEEIAFYDGAARERDIAQRALHDIYIQQQQVANVRSVVTTFDQLLVKYWASIAGYMVIASPFLLGLPSAAKTTEENTRDYILNIQYLTNMSNAVGNLVLAGNKLTTIAGYTHRVSELMALVTKLDASAAEPFAVRPDEDAGADRPTGHHVERLAQLRGWLDEWAVRADAMADQRAAHIVAPPRARAASGAAGGRIEPADHISFEGVDLVSPDGTVLARGLSFHVPRGANVMVTGPNGCGKSSLFRVIGELWPLASGVLRKPSADDILFVPQRPYLVKGTLRDQIIYPHNVRRLTPLLPLCPPSVLGVPCPSPRTLPATPPTSAHGDARARRRRRRP